MDMDVVISLKYGDFTERDPLIEVQDHTVSLFSLITWSISSDVDLIVLRF